MRHFSGILRILILFTKYKVVIIMFQVTNQVSFFFSLLLLLLNSYFVENTFFSFQKRKIQE